MTILWTEWNNKVIEAIHGKVSFYRDLYEGNHSKIFSRAKNLIDKGEIVDEIIFGTKKAQNIQTPYIMANISKLIPEIPAMLVSRSMGQIKSSIKSTEEQNAAANEDTDDLIDGPEGDAVNDKIDNLQDELIKQIAKNSNLAFEHWTNILEQQKDGGLVGVPWNDERGLRIDFKSRDVYYPHEDGLGCDLAFYREFEEEPFLHVYRERVEDGDLHTEHILYMIEPSDKLTLVEDEAWALDLLGLDELKDVFEGRSRPLVVYWPNEKTFSNPLGTSCLKNQEGKQDEINWTLTRSAITFERNGKPRIAVSTEIMQALKQAAAERYGDETKIDHRDLEITTFNDKGQAMEIIQIDISKIGDIQWVKDLMKMMFIETKTSEKAVDFYLDEGSSAAQSGVAKFYDLFISIVKAEQIQQEYIYFLQQLFENCLWLANLDDKKVIIEEPEIQLNEMIPISRKELVESNNKEYTDRTASLETVVRRNNPHASEEWIEEELARIEEESQGDDTTALLAGRQTLNNLNDNRDENGDPITNNNQGGNGNE